MGYKYGCLYKTRDNSFISFKTYSRMSTIETVWLDCDPGLDDALAIILAASHERINLIGVSTSAGNTTLEHTTRNALDLLFNVGKQHIPVVKGSN